jgi:hypothetical protein
MHRAISELLDHSAGVIGRRQYPELVTRMEAATRRHELVVILPGVYAHPDLATDWRTLVRGVGLWDESVVIVGAAGAALTYWPELVPRIVEVAG